MTLTEFKNIFDNGYTVNYTQGTSEIRCPKCGKESYLKTTTTLFTSKSIVTCENNHNFELIDFTVEWTKIRDGMLRDILSKSCDLNCNS